MKNYLFRNGTVLTMEGESATSQACVVSGGTILDHGTVDSMKKLAGPSCEEIDLWEGVLMPGFIDCHLHLVLSAFFKMNTDLALVGSVAPPPNTVRSAVKPVSRAARVTGSCSKSPTPASESPPTRWP